jgi:hypothetical protein
MLPHDLARPALAQPLAVHQHQDRSSPPVRAHQFPFATSRKASISSSLSATMRFSCTFSRSSSFKRFTSSADPLGAEGLTPQLKTRRQPAEQVCRACASDERCPREASHPCRKGGGGLSTARRVDPRVDSDHAEPSKTLSRRPDSNRGPLHYEGCTGRRVRRVSGAFGPLRTGCAASYLSTSGHVSGHATNGSPPPRPRARP